MGLPALLVFALVALRLGNYSELHNSGILLFVGIATAGAILGLLFVMFMSPSLLASCRRFAAELPTRLKGVADGILNSLASFRDSRGALVIALFYSFLLQTNVVLYHWIVAGAFGFDVPLAAFSL
jgi:hypothetical protein